MEMDMNFKKQVPSRAGSEKSEGITSVSQKQKGGKSLGITRIYKLNQSTICLVTNKKKPSAQIFLVNGPSRAKISFYGRKLYVWYLQMWDFGKASRYISPNVSGML